MRPQPSFLSRVLKLFWFAIKSYFILLGLLVTAVVLIFTLAISDVMKRGDAQRGGSGEAIKAKKIILNLDLNKTLDSRLPSEEQKLFRQLFSGQETLNLHELNQVIKRAEKDERIQGMVLNLSGFYGSLEQVMSLRRTLARFVASGREIQAYAPELNTTSYLLATAAKKVAMPAIGDVTLFGPTLSTTFFGGLMEKIGVDFLLLRAGKFKSAGESFVQNEPSPESKEMHENLVNDLTKSVIYQIALGRALPVTQIEPWFKQSIYTGKKALELGIVDALQSPKEFEESLQKQWPEAKIVSYADYLAEENPEKLPNKKQVDGIGFIEAYGGIVMDHPGEDMSSISPRPMIKQLEWMAKQSEVKSVVIRVDSPGGSALASDLIWQAVQALNEVKPVVISMGEVAASGGYYIAAPATKIIAESTTITGSIGVFGLLPNLAAFREKYGLSFYTYTGSERRDLLNPGSKPSEADKALIEEQIQNVYDTFLNVVAKGRKMDLAKVESLAGGQVWTGSQAVDAGLVDELGDLTHSFQVAKNLVGIDPDTSVPLYQYREADFWSECFSGLSKFSKCLQVNEGSHAYLRLAELLGLKNPSLERAVSRVLEGRSSYETMTLFDPRLLN